MTKFFADFLAEKDVLLADGATGTNLFNMGLQSGDAPELWNTDEPKKIMALYQGSVDAGSDLFLTNSFGGTAARLKLHDAQGRVRELNRTAAELGREVADKMDRKIAVAGSVGPTGRRRHTSPASDRLGPACRRRLCPARGCGRRARCRRR